MNVEWVEQAACRDMDPTIFYPKRGQPLEPAKAACARCPVAECLAEADRTEDRTSDHVFGFRGGLSVRGRIERRQRARIVKASRRPCGVCTLDGSYHPRTESGRVDWCKAADRNWPTLPLITKAGNRTDLCRLLGIEERRALPDWLTDVQADRWAIRAGWHPNQIWPGWSDAGLREVDRVFLESGWRQAWLHYERVTDSAVDAA